MMFSKGRQRVHKEKESSVKVRDSKTQVDLHTGAVHILRLPCTLILISAGFLQQSSFLLVDLYSVYIDMHFQSHFHPQQQMQIDSSQKNITVQQNTWKQNLQGIKENYITFPINSINIFVIHKTETIGCQMVSGIKRYKRTNKAVSVLHQVRTTWVGMREKGQ